MGFGTVIIAKIRTFTVGAIVSETVTVALLGNCPLKGGGDAPGTVPAFAPPSRMGRQNQKPDCQSLVRLSLNRCGH